MRTTITINDKLYKRLKIHAVESDKTVSSLLEDAVKYQLLEDMYDIELVKKRKDEPTVSFDSLVKELKLEGLL